MKVEMPKMIAHLVVQPDGAVTDIRYNSKGLVVPQNAAWHQVARNEYVVKSNKGIMKCWHLGVANSFFITSISDETANRLIHPDIEWLFGSLQGELEKKIASAIETGGVEIGDFLGVLKKHIKGRG